MKEINIKRKDRNIDVIKEKMLEILDEYEEAKEENNEDAMIKLEGYFKNLGYIIYVREFNVDNDIFLQKM